MSVTGITEAGMNPLEELAIVNCVCPSKMFDEMLFEELGILEAFPERIKDVCE